MRAIVLILLLLLAPAVSAREKLLVPTQTGTVRVEHFGDCAAAKCPAVLILSGSRGFAAPVYDEIGQTLKTAGLNAYLVHVLTPADLDSIAGAEGAQARTAYYAGRQEDWVSDVASVVAHLEGQARNGGKVGLLGISLGAQIAAAASAGQTGIDALVLVDGGFPAGYSRPVDVLPPLLLIWGSDDQTFPLAIATQVQGMARRIGVTAGLDVYQGGAHDFFLRAGTPNATAAHRSAADFLVRLLQ